jgi:SPP1 family predicted phage head-tail adaptor
MRAGKLDHKIALQESTPVRSTTGNVTYTWSNFAEPWAEIEPKGGRELFEARTVPEIDLVIKIRYVPGINSKMRVYWNSREFDILSILNIKEHNRDMLIACRELP